MSEATWFSLVKLAAFSMIPLSRKLQISLAIFGSMAAPMKKVCGRTWLRAKASLIRLNAVRAVFQCSSAPLGSMPPFSGRVIPSHAGASLKRGSAGLHEALRAF